MLLVSRLDPWHTSRIIASVAAELRSLSKRSNGLGALSCIQARLPLDAELQSRCEHDLGRNLLVDPNVGLAVDLNLERHDHTIVSVHKLSQLGLAPSRLRSKLKDLTTARFELTRLVGRKGRRGSIVPD